MGKKDKKEEVKTKKPLSRKQKIKALYDSVDK